MNSELLASYVDAFSRLHRNRHPRLGDAPHKPILLLAILHGIECGWISENTITLSPELVATFRSLWRRLVPPDTWSDKVVYPFRYLVHEGFWTLEKNGQAVPTTQLGQPTSIGQFHEIADTGRFTRDLWELLQERTEREVLRIALFDTYFTGTTLLEPAADMAHIDPLAEEVERLIVEAREIRFRKQSISQRVREADASYLRHSLFPKVVTQLYDHTCAVCHVGARDPGGRTLVDAAHIMPHARFGNDDPRNGLALCKNHHWAFDLGWIAVTQNYRIVLSPAVSVRGMLAKSGEPILLPLSPALAPATEALEWHRQNVFLQTR